MLLLALSLVLDGTTAALQDEAVRLNSPTSFQLMVSGEDWGRRYTHTHAYAHTHTHTPHT